MSRFRTGGGLIFSALDYGVMFVMVMFGLDNGWQRAHRQVRAGVLEGVVA